jgi:histidine ammonia-lyase
VLVCRLNSLAQGYSGVRWELLEQLVALIEHRVLPLHPWRRLGRRQRRPDPLSYVAAVLVGERDVRRRTRRRRRSARPLRRAPLRLAPKEGLAIMNGTAVMTALACLAWPAPIPVAPVLPHHRAGRRRHARQRPPLRPAPVRRQAACRPEAPGRGLDLERPRRRPPARATRQRLQDRYSIRCAPHVIGVARDALPWMRRDIENELNSANDNPLIDGDAELVLHGGHFYGGHIAFAMDALKTAVANLADLMDRQLALLVDNVQPRAAAEPLRQPRRARADQPRLQGRADRCFGVDRRSAEADHAGLASSRARPSATTRTR